MADLHRSAKWGRLALIAAAVAVSAPSCGKASLTSLPTLPTFAPVVPLTSADVNTIIARAVASLDSPDLHVAVVDRTGQLLGAYSAAGVTVADEDNIAVGLARTTAFFSNSQAPLSSRTVETLSTFHFPPAFSDPLVASQIPQSPGVGTFPTTVLAPNRTTAGVVGTAQGPLWQIQATNRGADIATAATTPPTTFVTDAQFDFTTFNPSRNIDATFPSPGIVSLPGAVPLYKGGRLVGGVGVYVCAAGSAIPDVAAGEFAAIQGATGDGTPGNENFFLAIPNAGAIYILGILLPYVQQTARPAGYGVGTFPAPGGGFVFAAADGRKDPFGYLIGPRAAVDGGPTQTLTQVDVETIIDQVVASANITRAQVRLPLGSGAKVIAVVVDTRGLILAHFRMEDTLCDAVDVVPAKARSVVYYCRPGGPDVADQWPGFPLGDPRGIALTTRTLGFLSQPFFPPGIDYNSANPGPLFNLARFNQLPAQATTWGHAGADNGYRNGLTFFPGSVPLYKNGELVGALGVSGDGVEQNDLIAFDGGRGFEPPPELRIDNFSFQGVQLPYLKFPQSPR